VEAWINQTKDSSSLFAYFMKERAQIEDLYAARLQQLLKNTTTLTEFGYVALSICDLMHDC
jgi:hypothetical protein